MPGRASSSTTRAAWSSPSRIFQDKNFNGRAYFARSTDNGASFTKPRPITADTTSQRFEVAGVDPSGRVFAAWLDKRNVASARTAGRAYPGAALAYAWEDGQAAFGDTTVAVDNTCECCRLGLAFAGRRPSGRGVPQHLPGLGARSRGHHVQGRENAGTGSSCERRRLEDRGLSASGAQPRHRRRTAPITSPGSPTAPTRKGVFYARADSADAALFRSRGPCRRRIASRRGPICSRAAPRCISCGRSSTARKPSCAGRSPTTAAGSWTEARTVADTEDASDHPLLVADGQRVYLSWLTKIEGYRLIALEDQP